MGSRFVQVTFKLKDELSKPMKGMSKGMTGLTDKLAAQHKQIGQLGRTWITCGKSIQRTGETLTKRVTLPIVAAGTASAKLYADFEKSMAQINTLLDDDSHLKSYEDTVLRVSDDLGVKATTMSEGLYQTISVLGDHGKTTEKTFEIMARSAKAGGAETVDAVNMIATAMNGYGETSDKTAQKISDLSFKTVKLGKTTFPELANNMSPLFPLAHNLGISYEELYATMSTATTSFAGNTAEASTQIKGLMTGFLKPSKDMQELYNKLGYSSGAAMIKSEGLAGALKLVQKEAGDDNMGKYFGNVRGLTAALGMSGSGMEKYEKHLKEMQNASGATGDALAKMGEADLGKWNKAVVRAQNAGIKFGKAVLPAVTPLVEKLGKTVSKVADWFSGLSESQQQAIVKYAVMAAAAGPALKLIGGGMTSIGKGLGTVSKFGKALDSTGKISEALTKTFPVMGRAINGLGTGFKLGARLIKAGVSVARVAIVGLGKAFLAVGRVFLTNPILLVIAAIAAGAILIWKNWDKIKPHLKPVIELFNKMKKVPGQFASAVKSGFNKAKEKFEELKEKAGVMKAGIQSRIEWIKSGFNSMKDRIGSAVKAAANFIKSFMSACGSSTSGIMGYLGGLIKFVKGVFTGNWRAAWNGVKQIFTSVFSSIRSTASSALNGISSLVSSIASKISGLMSKIRSAASASKSVKAPSVPGKAVGTNNWKGGPVRVHEKGGEILNLPYHTQIIPHDVSMEMARAAGAKAAGAGSSITIAKIADKIIVREDADIDRIATAIVEKLEMLQGDVVYA